MAFDINKLELRTESLDHHGIVAGCCADLEVAEMIDNRLYRDNKLDPRRVISAGAAATAMVINGLGFTNRRLYLTEQFFANKPVEVLLNRPHITSSDITDDALGKALDEIAEYGAEKLFGEIATEIALRHKLTGRLVHIDTTSLSTSGEYADEFGESEYVKVTYGHSKDHRPDCKQVIMSLVVNGANGIPLWCSPRDGNSSDKTVLYETIKTAREFCKEINIADRSKWVADAALYNKNNLLKDNSFTWLSRVPETISEAKNLSKTTVDDTWQRHDKGYSTKSVSSVYGGVKQRWLLVYSEQSYVREMETFSRNLARQEIQLKQDLWHFGNEEFKCEKDLNKALVELRKSYQYFKIEGKVVAITKYAKRGKPSAQDKASVVGYKYEGGFVRDEIAIQAVADTKGKFILATNDLDSAYSDLQMLTDYKEQQYVERGFRFLKDPWFMVKSIFLKSRKRITALMMIMALSLLIYNFAQYKVRKILVDTEDTLPNQLGKPVQNPTMRWIFQLMEGITVVHMSLRGTAKDLKRDIANLTALRRKIVLLFGGYACKIYEVV